MKYTFINQNNSSKEARMSAVFQEIQDGLQAAIVLLNVVEKNSQAMIRALAS